MECKVTLFDNEFERSFSNCSKEELDIIINFIKTSYYDGEINFQDSYGYLTNVNEKKIKKFLNKKILVKLTDENLDKLEILFTKIDEIPNQKEAIDKVKSNKKKTVKSNGEKSVLKEDASAPSSEITSLKEDISVTEKVTLEENLNLYTEKSNVKSIKNNSEVENIIGEPKIKKKKKKNISKEDNSSLDISKLNISDIKESVPNEPVTEKKKSNKKESKSEDLTKSTVSDNIKESVSSETITEKKKSNKKESKSEDLTKSTVSENIQETVSNEPVIEEPKVETNIVKKDKKIPKCSKCGQTGHNSRTCTLNK